MRYLLFLLLVHPALMSAQDRDSWRLPFAKGGLWGLMDGNGREIVPAVYAKIDFKQKLILLQKHDRKWTLLDTTLKPCASYSWDSLTKVECLNGKMDSDYENLWLTIWQKGKCGLLDALSGKVILPPVYDSLYGVQPRTLQYWQKGRCGQVDQEKGVILPPDYLEIRQGLCNNLLLRDSTGWGVYLADGKRIVPAIYDTALVGCNWAMVQKDGHWGWADGLSTPQTILDTLHPQQEPGWYVGQIDSCYYIYHNQKRITTYCAREAVLSGSHVLIRGAQGWGVWDTLNHELCPPRWEQVRVLPNGFAVKELGHWGYYRNGRLVIPPLYANIYELNADIIVIKVKKNQCSWYYQGKQIPYSYAADTLMLLGDYVVLGGEFSWYKGLHKADGTRILPNQYYNISLAEFGLLLARDSKGSRLYSPSGQALTEAFDRICQVDSTTAMGYDWRGKAYLLALADTAGTRANEVVTLNLMGGVDLRSQCNDSLRLDNRLWLKTTDKQLWGLTDLQARRWLVMPQYTHIRPYPQLGLTSVKIEVPIQRSCAMAPSTAIRAGVIDHLKGIVVVPASYDSAAVEDWQHSSLARAALPKGGVVLLQKDGTRLPDLQLINASEWSHGLTMVQIRGDNGTYYMNRMPTLNEYAQNREPKRHIGLTAAPVPTSQYLVYNSKGRSIYGLPLHDVKPCHKGVFPARYLDKWGLMDTLGRWVLRPTYANIEAGQRGHFVARLKEGGYTLLDTMGRMKLKGSYYSLEVLNDRLVQAAAKQRLKGRNYRLRYGLLDTAGRVVLPLDYCLEASRNDRMLLRRYEASWIQTDSNGLRLGTGTYAAIGTYGCNRVPVWDGKQWQYNDAQGRLAIAEGFTAARPFYCGVAWVRRQGQSHWTLIDTLGNALTTERYNYAKDATDGYAEVRLQGHKQWLNTQGKKVLAKGNCPKLPAYPTPPCATPLYTYQLYDRLTGQPVAPPMSATSVTYLAGCSLYWVQQPGSYTYYDTNWQPLTFTQNITPKP